MDLTGAGKDLVFALEMAQKDGRRVLLYVGWTDGIATGVKRN